MDDILAIANIVFGIRRWIWIFNPNGEDTYKEMVTFYLWLSTCVYALKAQLKESLFN